MDKVEKAIRNITPSPGSYGAFCQMIIRAAKEKIPRGHHKQHTPCWSKEAEELRKEFSRTGNPDTATKLLETIDN